MQESGMVTSGERTFRVASIWRLARNGKSHAWKSEHKNRKELGGMERGNETKAGWEKLTALCSL